jgi:hypothetical protein
MMQPSDTARVARLRKQHVGPNHALMYAEPLHIVRGEVPMFRGDDGLCHCLAVHTRQGMVASSLMDVCQCHRVRPCGPQTAPLTWIV